MGRNWKPTHIPPPAPFSWRVWPKATKNSSNTMEITPLTIYIWQLADGLKNACGGLSFLCAVLAVIVFAIACKEDWPRVALGAAGIFACTIILAAMSVLLPSSKTIAMMYVIPKMADSEVIKKDVPEMYEMAKEALREYVGKK